MTTKLPVPRVVFDTNVIVSAALLADSIPRQAVDDVLDRGVVLLSPSTASELNHVLRRSAFDKYLDEAQRLEFLAAFIRAAEFTEPNESINECRDASDNKFLELAVTGRATHIVSGDADLLVLHPFRGIAITKPRDFLTELRAQ